MFEEVQLTPGSGECHYEYRHSLEYFANATSEAQETPTVSMGCEQRTTKMNTSESSQSEDCAPPEAQLYSGDDQKS